MDTKKVASLEIWNKPCYIDATLSFLDTFISSLGLSNYQRFRFAIGEILRIRMQNAFPGTEDLLYVDFYLTDTYFEFSLRDKGVPGWQTFTYDIERLANSREDLRNYILDLCVDEVGMEKLGKEGQRIYARLKTKNYIQFQQPEPYQETEALDENISIRPVVTEEDAIEAIRCIYSEYGYSYAYERLYYVDSFLRMIRDRELMSFLAVNEHGQTAGHFALAFSDLYKNMPEISSVVIRKEFRKLGLFAKFMEHCIAIGKENNLRAMMGQPVAFHPMSQKACLKAGFTATSLLMSYLGSDLESEYNDEKERLNLCVAVCIFDTSVCSSIYPPKELVPFITKMYDRLGWRYEFLDNFMLSDSTEINIENKDTLQMTSILLRESSDDLEPLLQDAVRNAIRKKNEMIELLILLNSPSCEYGYLTAKKCGFVFSGIIPGGENGDYLVMQILPGDKLDYEKLVTVGQFDELKYDIINLTHS